MDSQFQNRSDKLRELQLAELELIKKFVDICDKEKLQYFMMGGTMLGAVRHKGYIPWDDDADFGLPRPEYEKFLVVVDKYLTDDCYVEDPRTFPDSICSGARLRSKNFKVRSSTAKIDRYEDVWIDIIPLDGMPNNPVARFIHKYYLMYRRAMFKYSHFSESVDLKKPHRSWYERFLINLGKIIPIEKFVSGEKALKNLEKAMKKYPVEKSNYLFCVMGTYKFDELFRKEVYGDGALYDFEGMKLRGPQDYDFYLTQMYGDYMTPPPENERNKHSTEFLEESD